MKEVQKEDRTNEKFNKTVLLRSKVVITKKIYIINRKMIDMVMTSVRGRGGTKKKKTSKTEYTKQCVEFIKE